MTALELLTPRERQVYSRRMAGEKTPAVAKALGISAACVCTVFYNAKTRIASGIPARGFPDRPTLSAAQLGRHEKRMRELARAKKCPVCQLRGKHECLTALAREILAGRADVGPAEVIFSMGSRRGAAE